VTRTLHFGTPSDEESNAYTRVLQGHIAIDMMQMPVMSTGTNGYRLDALARQYLWEDGLDYRHGSEYCTQKKLECITDMPFPAGHGVGSYLNVHEG
jgi:Xaa-Pro aminopeptidase